MHLITDTCTDNDINIEACTGQIYIATDADDEIWACVAFNFNVAYHTEHYITWGMRDCSWDEIDELTLTDWHITETEGDFIRDDERIAAIIQEYLDTVEA